VGYLVHFDNFHKIDDGKGLSTRFTPAQGIFRGIPSSPPSRWSNTSLALPDLVQPTAKERFMALTVFDRLSGFLQGKGVEFSVLQHAPVFTSEEAAAVRGTSLASGAKALICKADEQFVLIVLPADRRLASKQVRKEAGVKSLRFATREEVEQLTGLAPGSIPPFGSLFNFATWCDSRLSEQPRINFNAGDHAVSISMSYDDFLRVENPKMGSYSE
jgi:Ala-tRNA(Pro) deacylase